MRIVQAVLHPIRALNTYFDRQEAEERQLRAERGWSARQIAQQMSDRER